MSKKCQVSGKKYNNANRVSHSNRKTKHRQEPNLRWKRFWIPEENRWIRLRVCTKVLRTIDRYGVLVALKKYGQNPSMFKS